MNSALTTPLQLPPNSIEHLYLGGDRIAALRRGPGGPNHPEEWLGSAVTRFGEQRQGLTELVTGELLRDSIGRDPVAWLGAPHVARWGPTPGVLVKLLDAGQRLPVHVHPTREFAARHLDCPYGKSEAWVVIDVPTGGGTVFVGATRPVSVDEWSEMVAAQACDDMLALLNPVTVRPGDAVFVPSGTPHAIGEDVFVVELQEPTDFSVLLEWEGFAFDGPNDGHLGLGFDSALRTVRTDAIDAAALDSLIARRAGNPSAACGSGTAGDEPSNGRAPVPALPACAEPYFRAWRLDGATPAVTVPASFSVLVVLDGAGTLRTGDTATPLTRGDAYVVPHAAGPLTFDGDLHAVVAQPASHDAPDPVEWDSDGAGDGPADHRGDEDDGDDRGDGSTDSADHVDGDHVGRRENGGHDG